MYFSGGHAIVSTAGKMGYIDKEGKYFINPQFDNLEVFFDGLARITVDGKSGYIDKEGKYIWNPSI
jgi:hypothetical protein